MTVRFDKPAFLREHYTYELEMLRWADACLDEPMLSNMQHEFFQNAFAESFCMHARALIDFFDKEPDGDDIDAGEFCTPLDAGQSLCSDPLYTKLNTQVARLTRSRVGAEAISDLDRRQLRLAIEHRHSAFVAALPSELAGLIPPTILSSSPG